jgi:putative DNA methylase
VHQGASHEHISALILRRRNHVTESYRKKLIEVALPLEAISDASAAEKNVHVGLPANLHTWWSRKPLSASRAVIFASLVDDPGTDHGLSPDEVESERQRLFGIMKRLVYNDNMNDPQLLSVVEQEISRCCPTVPPFYDPFAGGGSIPLEAIRLGLDAFASDLNPVSVILNKVMIEIAPRICEATPVNPRSKQGALQDAAWASYEGFLADIDYYSDWIVEEAKAQIGDLYPAGPDGNEVIAWLWVRTVRCRNPACRAQMPLVKKFWLSTHKGNEAWAKPVVDRSSKIVHFEICRDGSPPKGTITSTGATCLVCGNPVPFSYIRERGRAGEIQHALMGIVTDGPEGRKYLPPDRLHSETAESASPVWVPETGLPEKALGFRVQNYGLTSHKDLFTSRQVHAVTTFASLIARARQQALLDSGGEEEYADALTTVLALAVDRLAQTNNTLVRWLIRKSGTSKGTPAFDRQIVSMVWEFSEGNVFGKSVGSWYAAIRNIRSAFRSFPGCGRVHASLGTALRHDAKQVPEFLPGAPLVSTDPPYFDNIGYADLSDFYYIWLRRILGDIYPDIFSTILTPKQDELTAAKHLHANGQSAAETHFLRGIGEAFSVLRSVADPAYPITIYYAFKETERFVMSDLQEAYSSTGWENMLEALVGAGLQITGTWPVKTEQQARLRALGSNALASSVVFCCRKRPRDAPLTSRQQFVVALRDELPLALADMQSGNVAPVDLAQASIGPGMAVYSRYARVLEPDGSPLTVRTALQIINHELDLYLSEQEGYIDRDSRFAVAWFEQFGFKEAPFGQADVLSRAKDTSVDGMESAGILEAGGGKVRLLHWSELDPAWDPVTDKRLTVWEATHHLIERLNTYGEAGTAVLLAKMSPDLAAQARQLAYRLYSISERKGWAENARDYNALVISWGASQEQAREYRGRYQQGTLFE